MKKIVGSVLLDFSAAFDILGQLSRPLTFLSLYQRHALSKASVSIYVDDSTLYTSATTASEIPATLNKEFELVSEWVARNTLVLNIF